MREIDFSFEPYRGPIKRMRKKISIANAVLVGLVSAITLVGGFGLVKYGELSQQTVYLSLMVIVYGLILYFRSLRMSKISDIWWAFATHNSATYEANTPLGAGTYPSFVGTDYSAFRDVITFSKSEGDLYRMYFADTGVSGNMKNGMPIYDTYTIFEFYKNPTSSKVSTVLEGLPKIISVQESETTRTFIVKENSTSEEVEERIRLLGESYNLIAPLA